MQVMYLGRAPHTKETLPDCLKWRRVTRHPLVFRGLTGSQRTPGFGASHVVSQYKKCIVAEIWLRGLYCKRRLRVYCRNCIAIWCIMAKKGLGAENYIAIQLLYCNLGREQ